jgi:hypothetical protein
MAKKPTFQQVKTSPFAVRPSKDTGPNPLADLGELGGGAMRVAKQGVDYLRRSTPQKVGSDAVSVAKGLYDQVAADPVKFGLDTLAAGPQAMVDFAEARDEARRLRASGDTSAARRLEEGAASILLGAIPVIGKAGKVGKAAKTAKAVESAVEKGVAAPAIVKRVTGAEKRAPSSAGYSRSELAVRYPETTPPIMKLNKDKGTYFEEKTTSPEAKALQKERAKVVKSMKSEGYTPFFNPNERYYVNPEDYPLIGDTRDIRPSRPDTLAKYIGLANAPDAIDRLKAAYARGSENPNSFDWYAMGQLEKEYKDSLGTEAGREAFKRKFAQGMAATTGGMDPDANLRLTHYMNYLAENGMPTPLKSSEPPYPIGGGKYGIMPNIAQYDRIINRGAGLSVDNPKRFNFSGNFLGHTKKSTLDEQMMGAWDPKMASPPSNAYGVYEDALDNNVAQYFGADPAKIQDVTWAGLKLMKDPSFDPNPMIGITNDMIERTSRLTGLSPEEVVHLNFIPAKRPMYKKGGSVDIKKLAAKYKVR